MSNIEKAVNDDAELTRMMKLKTFVTAWCDYFDLLNIAPDEPTRKTIEDRMSVCEKHIGELAREVAH